MTDDRDNVEQLSHAMCELSLVARQIGFQFEKAGCVVKEFFDAYYSLKTREQMRFIEAHPRVVYLAEFGKKYRVRKKNQNRIRRMK